MGKLWFSEECPFSFRDWDGKEITSVYAGASCVMAITKNAEVLQKVEDPNLAARTQYWNNVRSISISQVYPALAVGLINDGTCMVSKRALRHCCKISGQNFDCLNNKIKALKNIVQVCVSDSIFALDQDGKVHMIALSDDSNREYASVSLWTDIVRISVGNQNAVFGVTGKGGVVYSGANLSQSGPHGSLKDKLEKFQNVVDICALGSECERILLALSDGTTVNPDGTDTGIIHKKAPGIFCGNACVTAVDGGDGSFAFIPYFFPQDVSGIQKKKLTVLAVGLSEQRLPFLVGIQG